MIPHLAPAAAPPATADVSVMGRPGMVRALTAREHAVLVAMAEGMATKTIARHLGVAIKTVENHKIRIFDKLGVRTQAHAVSVAIGQGLLTTAPRRDPAAPAAGGFPPVVVGPVPAGVSPIAPATPSTMPRRPNSTEE